jgi:site-specific recombinase XerD
LRHSFATWFIVSPGNVVKLQGILGHSDIETTMGYVHVASAEDMREDLERMGF